MESAPLYIEKLVYRGDGLGHQDGKAVFVPFTVPGDSILWRLTEKKKRFYRGKIRNIVTSSHHRVPPECPVFTECGGCQWQHVSYETQVYWKQDIFRSALVRQLRIPAGAIQSLVPAPACWNYRCRARFRVRCVRKHISAGFFQRQTHKLIPIRHCPLLDHRLNRLLEEIWRYLLPCVDKSARRINLILEAGDSGCTRIILDVGGNALGNWSSSAGSIGGSFRPAAHKLVSSSPFPLTVMVRDTRGTTKIIAETRDSWSSDPLILPLGPDGIRLHLPPGGFSQINLAQNRTLVALVTDVVRETDGTCRILDLYCGMGNFTIPLAPYCNKIHGVDASEVSIRAAVRNAALNGIDNVSFSAASVEIFIQSITDGKGYDLVLLDPPRTGALEVLTALAGMAPSVIIYVSCDPMTLARDLKVLLSKGYGVRWSRPVDLFPHTYHIESVTVLDQQKK